MESIYETKIRHITALSEDAKKDVIKKIEADKSGVPFSNYVKITYKKCSSPDIKDIEPIMGSIFEEI